MKNFKWKDERFFGYGIDAQKVGEELEIVERGGNISPEHIIEYAERHKDSELYKCFEWDNDEASKKYRLHQARTVICSIQLEIKEEPREETRVYFNIKDKETKEKVYKSVKEISKDEELYLQIVEKAKKDFIRCKEKYESLLNISDLKEILFEIYRNI